MSISLCVFLEKAKLPSAREWAAAIRSNGFALDLDDTDLKTHSGFLPCVHEGAKSGFECSVGSAREALEGQDVDDELVGARDVVVDLVTHSDMRELLCATIAGAVLCAMTDGVIWETESGEWISAPDALRWARDAEVEIRREL